MRELLSRLSITGFDSNAWMNQFSQNASALPNIAVAASGGGYRAMLNGAGSLAAFDSRTSNSTSKGHIGGLLQSATYFAGLSGGSWLLGSMYINNFTSIESLIKTTPAQSGSLWQLGNTIVEGPATEGVQLFSTVQYWSNLVDAATGKADAGFNTSLTDLWGRGLSFQFINATAGGPGITWSSLQDDPAITSAGAPLPFVVADGRAPGETLIPANTTIFEFTPWELGSYDQSLFGFAPLKYVGSNFSAGALPNNEACIAGFDNAGFVMGTSSSLFNQILLNLNFTSISSSVRGAVQSLLQTLSEDNNDIADWTPNPFYHYNNASNRAASSKRLTLVDGGEDLQNLPLHPLLQSQRAVDVIFAVDSSADTLAPGANWPNGTALVATYQRSISSSIPGSPKFPQIPDQNTFVNLGLNNRPTFFGCNATSTKDSGPLVVYIPNSPYVYYSNTSTFTMKYNNTERNAIVQNGYNVATMGNGTRDAQWPACVGCAILSRSLKRTGTPVPEVCNQCFERYCWDGRVNSTTPAPYMPAPLLAQIKVSGADKGLVVKSAGAVVATAVVGLLVW